MRLRRLAWRDWIAPSPARRDATATSVAVAALLVAGGTMVAAIMSHGHRPPEPPAVHVVHSVAAAPSSPAGHRAGHPAARRGGQSAAPTAVPLSFAVPAQVAIPAIGVVASVIPLGENPDGTVQVPPLTAPQLTSWFDDGPAPGQTGPAALYGHVDTAAAGPAVFYRLGDLAPGDTVDIARADHRVAVFAVYRVAEYAKNAFPTMTVYGDTSGPELRLITCGGAFDSSTGSYLDNIVVYARLISAAAQLQEG